MRRSLQILFVLTISLVVVPVAALAQRQAPNDRNGKNHLWGANRNTTQNSTTTRVQQGWVRTAPRPIPALLRWAQGRKAGWHGNEMPPGQASRDPYEYRHRRYYGHHRDFDHDQDRFRHDRYHDYDRH